MNRNIINFKWSVLLSVISACVFVLSFSACNNDTGSGGHGSLHHIDIVNARMLTIAPADSDMARATGAARQTRNILAENLVLFKQLDNGEWVQVRMTDEDGREVFHMPLHVMELTDNWIAIEFRNPDPDLAWNMGNTVAYLVNKTDGRAYDITFLATGVQSGIVSFWRSWGITNRTAVYTGHPVAYAVGNNRLIVTSPPPAFVSLNIRLAELVLGATQGDAKMITPPDFNVRQFAVDRSGNLMYEFGGQGGLAGGDFFSIRTADGNVIPLPNHSAIAEYEHSMIFAFDGSIYFLAETGTLYRVGITGNTPESVSFTPVTIEGNFSYDAATQHLIQFPDRTVIFNDTSVLTLPRTGNAKAVSLQTPFGDNDVILAVSPTARQTILVGVGGVGSIWQNTRIDRIVEINPATGTVTDFTLSPDVAWALNFEVSGNGIVTADVVTDLGRRRLIVTDKTTGYAGET